MSLRVFIYGSGTTPVAVTLVETLTMTPSVSMREHETMFVAAVRQGKEAPLTEVELSKTWSFAEIVFTLALAGFVFKKFVVSADGKAVNSSQRTGDLLVSFRGIEDADGLRYFLQQVLNGDVQVRLEPVPGREARIGAAEPHGDDGDAIFVG